MQKSDLERFSKVLTKAFAFYDKAPSKEQVSAWFDVLTGYELEDISRALGAHIRNPDAGQYPPKPADVVKALVGTSDAVSQSAWTKLERAVSSVGPWRSVVFDDPIIHRIVIDMGGWVRLCNKSGEEWPHVHREFLQRYKGFFVSAKPFDYPGLLLGTADDENRRRGLEMDQRNLALIGDKAKAWEVHDSGQNHGSVPVALGVEHEKRIGRIVDQARLSHH